jgi:hypothetical protein
MQRLNIIHIIKYLALNPVLIDSNEVFNLFSENVRKEIKLLTVVDLNMICNWTNVRSELYK